MSRHIWISPWPIAASRHHNDLHSSRNPPSPSFAQLLFFRLLSYDLPSLPTGSKTVRSSQSAHHIYFGWHCSRHLYQQECFYALLLLISQSIPSSVVIRSVSGTNWRHLDPRTVSMACGRCLNRTCMGLHPLSNRWLCRSSDSCWWDRVFEPYTHISFFLRWLCSFLEMTFRHSWYLPFFSSNWLLCRARLNYLIRTENLSQPFEH